MFIRSLVPGEDAQPLKPEQLQAAHLRVRFILLPDYRASTMVWNADCTLPPSVVTTVMHIAAISATIIPYSTIVAPSSSLKNLISFFMYLSPFRYGSD
jgi:hypothetical protein